MSRRVHQNQNVERIAVLSERGRKKTEVKRKHHPFGQQSGQLEETGIRIIIEFVAKPFWSFYDRPADRFFDVELQRKRC